MSNNDVCYMSTVEMVEAIKTKRLSPVEIMNATLSRIEQLNPRFNAYCTLVPEMAMRQAREAEAKVMKREDLGPLHGVPIAVKDTMLTKGIRTTFGSRVYEHFVPDEDTIIVERLKAAGAIIVGKTNVPEFATSGIQTENVLFGATRNPWNLELSPGGSGGGSGVALAAGLCQLATGSDAGGSIRIPAAFCGLFGFKPSFGRVPRYPRLPPTYDMVNCFGPMSRTVRDTALALETTAGRDDRDFYSLPERGLRYLECLATDLKGLRIAWVGSSYSPVDPQVLRVTESALRIFETLGAEVVEDAPPVKAPEKAFSTIFTIRQMVVYEDKLPQWSDRMDPRLLERLVEDVRQNKDRPATDYARAQMDLLSYWDGIRPFFEKYDLWLTPTTAILPPKLGQHEVKEIAGVEVTRMCWFEFLYPFNVTGQPAASLPCGWTDDGLPVGLQIVGRRFDDVTVLRASAAFEEASPWADKRPVFV